LRVLQPPYGHWFELHYVAADDIVPINIRTEISGADNSPIGHHACEPGHHNTAHHRRTGRGGMHGL
jgi:hypothetical protein